MQMLFKRSFILKSDFAVDRFLKIHRTNFGSSAFLEVKKEFSFSVLTENLKTHDN